jgi:hypothetical protein
MRRRPTRELYSKYDVSPEAKFKGVIEEVIGVPFYREPWADPSLA